MNKLTKRMKGELFVRFFSEVTKYNQDMATCFWQIEKMFWYYLDVTKSSEKPSKISMKIFIDDIKDYLLQILPIGIDIDDQYERWMCSRQTIPRCKVILLDAAMENMILTKGAYNDYLIFPGGKVEETDNNLIQTAIRETYEEIGLDIRDIIQPESYFDLKQYGVQNRYFVIPNIDKNTYFYQNVPNEIEYTKWFPIRDFPNDIAKHNLKANNVKLIRQSVEALKSFIALVKSF
jgi:8-oxo-dGTP pyrophosphatase MutT (NUDIX family)